MQQHKERFRNPNGSTDGTLQSCVRTNDLDLVGDGTHLNHFQMLGNFSFGGPPYEASVEMWSLILEDLGIRDGCEIHVHPDSTHRPLWERLGYPIVSDSECMWSDGGIGGYCCEIYRHGVEIGNLVNPLGVHTDVGFGWERVVMAMEGKSRVDETSLFDQTLHPVLRDHVRTLECLRRNGVGPGSRGRSYVCRRLLRRMLRHGPTGGFTFSDWLKAEHEMREKCLKQGRRLGRRHRDKPPEWWWETCGLTAEDLDLLN